MKEATKQAVDVNQEPKTHEEHVSLETHIEDELLKKVLPEYTKILSRQATTESALAFNLACLKAVRVGKGRDGEWTKYAEAKFSQLTIRTMDRWIARILEEQPVTLPDWVVKRLMANKRAPRPRLASPEKAIKMSLPLVLDEVEDHKLDSGAKEIMPAAAALL